MKTSREKADAPIAPFPPCPEHGPMTAEGYCQTCANNARAVARRMSEMAIKDGRCPVCLVGGRGKRKKDDRCDDCYLAESAGTNEAISLRAAGYCPVCCGIPSRSDDPCCHYCHTRHEDYRAEEVAVIGGWTEEMVVDTESELARKTCVCGRRKGSSSAMCKTCKAKEGGKCACGAIIPKTRVKCDECKRAHAAESAKDKRRRKGVRERPTKEIIRVPCLSCGDLCRTGHCKTCSSRANGAKGAAAVRAKRAKWEAPSAI